MNDQKLYYVMFPDNINYEDRVVYDFNDQLLTYDEAKNIQNNWLNYCRLQNLPKVRILKIIEN